MGEKIAIGIVGSLVVMLLFAIIIDPIILTLRRWLLPNRKTITKYIYRGEEIIDFGAEKNMRVSVSVLASIKKDEKYLLKSKNPTSTRQDGMWKPLGGALRINDSIETVLGTFSQDQQTRYSAKGSDLRIFKKLSNNKLIHKALYSNDVSYYISELKREMREEMNTTLSEIEAIFSFDDKQPKYISINYKTPEISPMQMHDYTHHLIFNVIIKDEKRLNELLKKNILVGVFYCCY